MATPKKGESKQDKVNPTDDNENKGGKGKIRRQGRRATRRMDKEQAKDDLKYNPVVDHATPKQQSARALGTPPQRPQQPLVKRFVGSTPNIGKNNAMKAMVEGTIKAGLSAATSNTVSKAVKATQPRDMAPSFKPSARTMELGSAHDEPAVGEAVKSMIHTSFGGGVRKPPVVTANLKKAKKAKKERQVRKKRIHKGRHHGK